MCVNNINCAQCCPPVATIGTATFPPVIVACFNLQKNGEAAWGQHHKKKSTRPCA